ncbi:MAG: hypothetical protein ACRCZH_01635, partial [Cetobacterium sp.]
SIEQYKKGKLEAIEVDKLTKLMSVFKNLRETAYILESIPTWRERKEMDLKETELEIKLHEKQLEKVTGGGGTDDKAIITYKTEALKKFIGDRIKFINENKDYLILSEKNKKFKVKELIFTGTHLVVKTECGKIKDYGIESDSLMPRIRIQISTQKINLFDLSYGIDIEGMIKPDIWENKLNLSYLTNF